MNAIVIGGMPTFSSAPRFSLTMPVSASTFFTSALVSAVYSEDGNGFKERCSSGEETEESGREIHP